MKNVLILADGEFPTHPVTLGILKNSDTIVCCDGAAAKLISYGVIPKAIVGDMDSLDAGLQKKYKALIQQDSDQETNDLTKAFEYSLTLMPDKIIILGATGAREDHTIGNISLISNYRERIDIEIEMYTNSGKFIAINTSTTINLPVGSQVSVFSLDTNTTIISKGLKYPLNNVVFDSWWKGTLNETTEDSFTLDFQSGRVIIFIAY
ncbi:MAG: thiamine diphosphokinase [Rikenellaceae bacterium]